MQKSAVKLESLICAVALIDISTTAQSLKLEAQEISDLPVGFLSTPIFRLAAHPQASAAHPVISKLPSTPQEEPFAPTKL